MPTLKRLTISIRNAAVATISATGRVKGLTDGATILSVSRNHLQAVTAVRVGDIAAPTNDAELQVALAETNGLNVYPQAVTLTEGVKRQIVVGLNGILESKDLKFGSSGTHYFVSNPSVLQVSTNGLITALDEGVATVTVVHGAAEKVVPVRVEMPNLGSAILGTNGGVVQASDGAMVMVAPGALSENATVSIEQLSPEQLPLPMPNEFSFAGAFKLDVGSDPLAVPVQLAIPAPVGLAVGTEVFFMRQGELPDQTGTWNSIWIIEESGVVGTDGMIRTQSPPWQGVDESAPYVMAVPKFEYSSITVAIPNSSSNANYRVSASNFVF